MNTRYGSRKFILCVLVILASCGLVVGGFITGGEIQTIWLGTIGVYLAANVAQKAFTQNTGITSK